jgi:hypothetical protein
MLLAEVHALLGFGKSALGYAEEMREYFLRVGAPDWETAFCPYRSCSRRIVSSTFSHVPKP